jgi:hypothetical protein
VGEAHSLAIVPTDDTIPARVAANLDPNTARTRIAGILEQLADENPGVRAVPIGFETGAIAECRTSGRAHEASVFETPETVECRNLMLTPKSMR